MSREREEIPWAMWLGFLAAALVTHAVMVAPTSAALAKALREPVPQDEKGAGVLEFEMVEDEPKPLDEDADELVQQHRANDRPPPEDTRRIAEVDSNVDHETKAPNQPNGGGGTPSKQGEQGQDQAQPREQGQENGQQQGQADADGQQGEAQGDAQGLMSAADGSQQQSGAAKSGSRDPLAALAGSPGALRDAFGPNGSHDVLRDVDEGVDNVLDSKKHRFASFFNRIRDAVADQWRPQQAHDAADPSRAKYGDKQRTTILMVRLDESGELLKVVIERASGAPHLDEEAVRAMKAAAPFPNPPAGLAEDGHIDFRFGFILDFDGSTRIFRYQK